MMDRLLLMKKSIVKFFRCHPNSPWKLSGYEWHIANEVCSLLNPVAEVTTRIQGSQDAFLSQIILLMT